MGYQLFPDLTPEEYNELKEDIISRGVQIPIELDDIGNVLDGHNRLKICKELGISDYPTITRFDLTEEEKKLHIRKLNLARRHLSQDQKRKLINQQLKETPQLSDRRIAKGLGIDHKTVGTARQDLEGCGEIPHIKEIIDTIGRKQPRHRSVYSTGASQEKLKAIADKKPELIEKVDAGEITINAAFHLLRGDWYQMSETPEWETPQWLFDLLNDEFSFTLDVCASEANHKCERYFSRQDNGLSQRWAGACWVNPPYGREIKAWMQKAKTESENGATVVCLVPARPDTEWWWENCIQGEIRFIRGRLQWPGSNTAAPFPSAVVVMGKQINAKVIWWDAQKR